MPWKEWIEGRHGAVTRWPTMPLTMITLTGRADVPADEYRFYARAEREMLTDWANAGWLVLAFPALDRDEMTLICTEPLAEMRERVTMLPLVAAKLVTADLRRVVSMRFAEATALPRTGNIA